MEGLYDIQDGDVSTPKADHPVYMASRALMVPRRVILFEANENCVGFVAPQGPRKMLTYENSTKIKENDFEPFKGRRKPQMPLPLCSVLSTIVIRRKSAVSNSLT